MSLAIHPLTPTIGAEISNINLADVSASELEELRKIWLDWKVLFFRDQHITKAEHIAFGRRFGDLEVHPFAEDDGEHAEIVRITSNAEKQYAAALWHSDVTWRQEPSLGSILRGVTIPPVGGDTCFADAAAAYERLPQEFKDQFDGKFATHDYVRAFGAGVAPEEQEKLRTEYPPARHPVFRTHPETGAKSIYTNRAFVREIDGLTEAESYEVILRLERAISDPSVQCRFRWEVDSFAMWDNRAVQHFGTNDFYPETRAVERVTIIGDKPV